MASYLVDKSALARIRKPAVAERLVPLIEDGEAATCAIIELEVLYSARSRADLVRTSDRRRLAYEWVALTDEIFERALEVQQSLAQTGHHRVAIPDLIVAAAAESADLTVLHYDRDFDHITTQMQVSCEWVVPRGTVD